MGRVTTDSADYDGSCLREGLAAGQTSVTYGKTREVTQWRCIKDLRGFLTLHHKRHGLAREHYELRYLACFFPTVVLAAAIPVLESILEDSAQARKVSIICIGAINTVLIAFANMKGYQSLRDKHADAETQYNQLKIRLDAHLTYPLTATMCKDMTKHIQECLTQFQQQVDDLSYRCPAVPFSIRNSPEAAIEVASVLDIPFHVQIAVDDAKMEAKSSTETAVQTLPGSDFPTQTLDIDSDLSALTPVNAASSNLLNIASAPQMLVDSCGGTPSASCHEKASLGVSAGNGPSPCAPLGSESPSGALSDGSHDPPRNVLSVGCNGPAHSLQSRSGAKKVSFSWC